MKWFNIFSAKITHMHMKSTVTPEFKKDAFTNLPLVQEMLMVTYFVLTFGGYVPD